ncbi:hypothetical protein [Paenibacillus sp. SI8]|uniref:hypothetical protein n=1 Tax=unclassified Paenibacillus TaxID=185978 RepID=UPI00346619AB
MNEKLGLILFSIFLLAGGLMSIAKPQFAWKHGFAGQKSGKASKFDLKLVRVIGYFLVFVGIILFMTGIMGLIMQA